MFYPIVSVISPYGNTNCTRTVLIRSNNSIYGPKKEDGNQSLFFVTLYIFPTEKESARLQKLKCLDNSSQKSAQLNLLIMKREILSRKSVKKCNRMDRTNNRS